VIVDFSPDQEDALAKILDWRDRYPRGSQHLTLGGYAGTGKTTIVSYLSRRWEDVAIATLCGKAAHVLRSRGAKAQTVHSLIYVPVKAPGGKTRFRRRQTLSGFRTLIIDEASMIDHVLFQDLMSYGLPILFVGDHGQLEPIGTNANLMLNPNVRLENIHRQARENPILRLASAFREGKPVSTWEDRHGRLRILDACEFPKLISPNVQLICGFNKTRHQVNAHVREMLGIKDLVAPGEKLICLKNNKSLNIFNGQQVTVLDIFREGRETIDLEVETDDDRCFILPCLRRQFGQNRVEDFKSKEVAQLDYGYCLTAHKAQGSEWDEVVVLEQISKFWDARRWRYTVVTRAKKKLTYCGRVCDWSGEPVTENQFALVS
jgi:exodeoxyribonuclease-5